MDGTTREFQLDGSGVNLKLRKGSDDLTQRDMDVFMAAYGHYPQGNTPSEDHGKTVRAAFDAKWIEEFTIQNKTLTVAGDVNDTHPGYIRWAAAQIDSLIARAREVPIPLS